MSGNVRSKEIIGSALVPKALRSLQTNIADALPSNATLALADASVPSNASLRSGAMYFLNLAHHAGSSIDPFLGYFTVRSYAQAIDIARGCRYPVKILTPLSANASSPLLKWTETALSRSQPAQASIDRMKRFQTLPRDWDGDGTVIVSDDVVSTAIAIIDALEYADLSLPQSSPSAEGDIGLNWYYDCNTLEMTILADGHVVWVTDIDNRVEPGRDIRVASLLFPSLIVEAVRGFYTKVSSSVPLPE